MDSSEVEVKVKSYAVWAVEILCNDARGRPRQWEIWDVHVLRADAFKQSRNMSPKIRTRVRRCVPVAGRSR